MPQTSGRPNQLRNTAAAPVRNALTFTMTDTPSSAKVSQVRIFLMRPENSSASKQLTNCAPLLLYESSAIMRCSTMFMR